AAREDQRRRTRGSLSSVEDGQRPAPAGQLAGNRGVRDNGPLVAGIEGDPPFVQAPVRALAPVPGLGSGLLPAPPQINTGAAVGLTVMPGRLDQQPPGVPVPGLGDRPL